MQLDCGLISRTRTAARGSRVKLFLLAASVAVLIAPSAALADATLSPGLRDRAAANPHAVFKVIVQGEPGQRSKTIGKDVVAVTKAQPGSGSRHEAGLPLDRRGLRRADRSADSPACRQARDRDDHRGHTGACDERSSRTTNFGPTPRKWRSSGRRSRTLRSRCPRSPSSTPVSNPDGRISGTGSSLDVDLTSLPEQLRGRRAGARHLRRQHRSRRRRRLRRRFPEREARLARRDRRLGHGPDERRDRRCRLDPREQGPLQHPRRQLLAAPARRRRASGSILSTRPWSVCGSAASWSSPPPGTTATKRRACSSRRPTTRSSSLSEPTTSPGRFPSATTSPRHGRRTARRSTDSSSPRSRPPAGC